ncbi:DCL family protein [Aureimonas sp. Leaf324]|jgi:hypothetical protein|uniref:DCL family protein n=1 Tax=Aureimonas sp. Leaf324 TaxID=1736336 RepID=UPI0006F8BA51|nr:DCL family protein [Aureimonas sp. Leaf324]KQQ86229.1 hypothetical protein ASF65_06875 [Aureimonas sp. Leaf324]
MPAMPISFGVMQFAKKGDAAEYLRSILNRYDVGDRVSAEDAVILHAALERHPEAETIKGGGITHFSVRTADYGTKCFWANRADGSTEKFSHKACVYATRKVRERDRHQPHAVVYEA